MSCVQITVSSQELNTCRTELFIVFDMFTNGVR